MRLLPDVVFLTLRPLAVCLLIWSSLFVGGVQAQDTQCVEHAELIVFPEAELSSVTPCDHIGAMYLLGLGVISTDLPFIGEYTIEPQHGYYIPIRIYIHSRDYGSSVTDEDLTGYLLLGSALAPEVSSSGGLEEMRGNIYKTFIIGEYWDAEAANIPDTKPIFEDFLQGWMQDGPFPNMRSLRCFIKHDIVTLSVESILNSERYSLCLGGA